MIKNISALVLCAVLCLCVFAGCSDDNNSEIVGKWVPTTVTIGSSTVPYSDLVKEGREFSLTFESNGKCKIILGGIENEGEFTFNETSVDINYSGQSMKLDYNRGVLTLNLNYNNETTSYLFSKVVE